VELIDEIVGGPSGVTSIIDVLVFRAAGEDMSFSNLTLANANPPTSTTTHTITSQSTLTTTINTERVEHQCSIRNEFTKPFDTIACDCSYSVDKNLCTSDQLTSVNEILKRYCEFHNMNTTGGALNDIFVWPVSSNFTPISSNLWWLVGALQPGNLPVNVALNPFQYFLSLFLYVRGDIRIRFIDYSASSGIVFAGLLDINSRLSVANSMTISDLHATPELSFEVPYSSMIPWHPIQGPVPCSARYNADMTPHFAVDNGTNSGFTSSYEQFISASDNFLAGILMPPPRVEPIPSGISKNNKQRSSLLRSKVRDSQRKT